MLEADFKNAMRRLAASVTIIAAFDRRRRPHGLVVSSLCSLTAEPPMILACVNTSSSIWPVLSSASHFGASILHLSQQSEAQLFTDNARREERFAEASWDMSGDAPLLRDAQAGLVCKIEKIVPNGSHNIVIGAVCRIDVRSEVTPLVYLDGNYATVAKAELQDCVAIR
jgi:flavin reductase (DIM6/NTAB) family NADH-FMN oxidoreductase RutF